MSRAILSLILLCSLTFLAGLGRQAVTDSDEAYYAESAREMTESGQWVTPHYNYQVRFQKPILFYWLVAVSYEVFGIGAAAARLPSALAGLGLVLIAWWCGTRWYRASVGWLAGAITATSFGYFTMARLALPDLPLAFFISLSTWAFLEALKPALDARPSDPPPEHSRSTRWWLITASAASAAAFLTKGPVGLALPVLIVLAACGVAARRSPGTTWRALGQLCRGTDLALGVLVFLAIAVPWYAAMWKAHGAAYLYRFFISENLERFATDRYNVPRPVWFYIPIVLGGLLPWSPFVLLGLRPAGQILRGRLTPSADALKLMLWAATILLFYTISIGKQPRYVLPALPPLAILLARLMDAAFSDAASRSERRTASIAGLLAGLVVLFLGLLVFRADGLFAAGQPARVGLAATLLGISGAAISVVSVSRHRTWTPPTIACSAALTLLALQFFVLSTGSPEPVQRIAAAIAQHRSSDEAIGSYRVLVRNLVFYTQTAQDDLFDAERLRDFVRSTEPVLCVISEGDLADLERDTGLLFERLASERYFNPAALKLGMLLWPDPDTDLETVLLVTNRPGRPPPPSGPGPVQ